MRFPPFAISKIVDLTGKVVYEYKPSSEQVIRPEHAYLISSILSDNAARSPMFGPNSVLALPFNAAAKTGTTNDFRDNWTLGYTPDLVVGVWVGNADYTPMVNTTGLTGAAPIWAEFMQYAVPKLTGNNPTPFFRPAGIVDRVICAISGAEPSQWCPEQRAEMFAADQLPLPKEQDLWMKVLFDTWTNLRASPACGNFTKEDYAINVTDPWALAWILLNGDGQAWAERMGFKQPFRFVPSRDCAATDPRPVLAITSPTEGQTISVNPLEIFGQADASADFKNYTLSYGVGTDPVEWKLLKENNQPASQPEKMYTWNLTEVLPGRHPDRGGDAQAGAFQHPQYLGGAEGEGEFQRAHTHTNPHRHAHHHAHRDADPDTHHHRHERAHLHCHANPHDNKHAYRDPTAHADAHTDGDEHADEPVKYPVISAN